MRVIHRSCISRMRRDLHYSSAFLGANGSKRTAEPLTFVSRPSSRRTHPTQNATTRIGHTGPGPSGYDTADAIFKARKYPLLAAGVVALGCGIYVSMMVSSFAGEPSADLEASPTGRPPKFTHESARQFDSSLDASEEAMGIISLRKDIGRLAMGHVLEVALGTGRNMAFYDWSRIVPSQNDTAPGKPDAPQQAILSFTGVDISADMLGVAIDKLPKAVPGMIEMTPTVSARTTSSGGGWREFAYLGGKIRVAQCDIQGTLPPPEPTVCNDQKYDTVVQTFGLCSVSDPEKVLSNLASAVKLGTGRIILVEHGRGWWRLVNTLLDWSALAHYRKYGCWWNRDIVGIIERAAELTPGLRIVRLERPFITQLGTTVWVELAVDSLSGSEPSHDP
ncbi:hypothetical protein BN1723_003121 [Verticillium longisporum]|uniref:Methyltransferase type 11 domain-containing protein n=1 Tax=Verticillium longisporum TaxID=100787 RepID=A0A0G4KZM5_VERLO|nr:hypothetical protein BN1708_011390 [Verticillium longisporum]CRK23982.1 hypothetical protein BN1723_003121 [Verticillium longisporum]